MRSFVTASLVLGLSFFVLSHAEAQHGNSTRGSTTQNAQGSVQGNGHSESGGSHGNGNGNGHDSHGNGNGYGHGPGAEQAPELSANAMPAALALLAGGAVLLTNRRRRFV